MKSKNSSVTSPMVPQNHKGSRQGKDGLNGQKISARRWLDFLSNGFAHDKEQLNVWVELCNGATHLTKNEKGWAGWASDEQIDYTMER